MKVKMLGGYGDIDAGTYVNFTDDAEGQRFIDNNAARPLATKDNWDTFKSRRDAARWKEYIEADAANGDSFVDSPAPEKTSAGKGKPAANAL